MFDKIEAFISRLSTRDNFWHSICSFIWLPLAFFSGIRTKQIGEDRYQAILPFRKFNKNWYNAMAGGALLGNAEIAGGMYVFGIVGSDYTVVCKNLNYTFLRPCLGPAVYHMQPRSHLRDLVASGTEFNFTLDMEIMQQPIGKKADRERRVGKCEVTFHITRRFSTSSKRCATRSRTNAHGVRCLSGRLPESPCVRAREVVRVVQSIGFVFDRQKRSHAVYLHPADNRRVVIPMHGSKDLKPGTLRGILADLGIDGRQVHRAAVTGRARPSPGRPLSITFTAHMRSGWAILAGGCVSFVLSVVLTRLMIWFAPRVGFVDKPGHRKIHNNPKPLGGGVALFWSFALTLGMGLAVFVGLTMLPGLMDRFPRFRKHNRHSLSVPYSNCR